MKLKPRNRLAIILQLSKERTAGKRDNQVRRTVKRKEREE